MQRLVWLICLSLGLSAALVSAKPLSHEQVPDPLKPWIAWVSEPNPEGNCPFLYTDPEQKRCLWPTAIQFDLSAQKGQFTSTWQVYKDVWVGLPGDAAHWPQNVMVNKQTALVMDREGGPSIKLLAGAQPPSTYQITGEFFWERIPDNLSLPADTGLIQLSINGEAINTPTLREGQLWLKDSESGQKKPDNVQNSLDIQVFRHFTDSVPMQAITRIILDVAGEQRELKLPKPLLDGFIPLTLDSPLPARLEADGQLLLQLRPGHWQIDLTARSVSELTSLPLPAIGADWPASEIWLFQADPEVRVVEIEQLPAIDTRQNNVPEEWQRLPAYSIKAGQAMGVKVIRRGDPEPDANQLVIKRKLWLDFDGGGYTAHDTIIGTMARDWRLNTLASNQLGKATLNHQDLLITRQAGSDKQGVEVRPGGIDLQADSRIIGNIGELGAVGWEQDFQQAEAELNLPPGWRLLAAFGVDNVPDCWLWRWTLLDWFLVLCAAVAVGKLWQPYWGALALVALVLIWQEPHAPQWVWLHILAAIALLKALPEDKFLNFRRVLQGYRLIGWLALVLQALPFMTEQVHNGWYPQLEAHGQAVEAPASPLSGIDSFQVAQETLSKRYPMFKKTMMKDAAPEPPSALPPFERVDSTAKVQTGPGLPQWQWHTVHLSWNGAVTSQQQLSLWYLSPRQTALLNFLRVLFVAVLALLMFGVADKILPKPPRWRTLSPAGLGLLLLPLLWGHSPDSYADYPSDALLQQLKTRLEAVDKPDCLPNCADIPQMQMRLDEEHLEITLQIHAAASVLLPLPADYGQWFPHEVLDNGAPATALYRDNNSLWLHLSAGGHRVVLRGTPPLLSQFTLPLPLKPKRVVLDKSGWEVVGLQDDGVADSQLQFSRTAPQRTDGKTHPLETGPLPAFIRVERIVQLGLDWRVETRIVRLSPLGNAVLLKVGLLPGEAVSSAGIHVKDNAVEVNMAAQDSELTWQSTLARIPTLTLTAPATEQWTEVWRVDASPIWHLESQGIAPIHSAFIDQWQPEWRPWPGETVALRISRPEAVNGQTLTIDDSQLDLTPGQRQQTVVLRFRLKSSQGGQHTLTLPETAALQSVTINGQSQPLRPQGRKLTLPITPGQQKVELHWQAEQPLGLITKTPSVDLGLPSVNSRLTVNLGADRWVLWVAGPTLGPAVLFWGVLLVILMVALGLDKIRLTPLRHWQWFLLLLGLSQVPMATAGIVIVWLILLGWRHGQTPQTRYFNAVQVLVVLTTLVALAVLFGAVAQGLLNSPDMRITGNGSTATNLNWYQDRSAAQLPQASIVSVPLIAYRLLMLAWSLWLAMSLVNWLKWGWGCFASNGLWRKAPAAPVAVEPPKDGAA